MGQISEGDNEQLPQLPVRLVGHIHRANIQVFVPCRQLFCFITIVVASDLQHLTLIEPVWNMTFYYGHWCMRVPLVLVGTSWIVKLATYGHIVL